MTRGVYGQGRFLCRHCQNAPDWRPRGLCWVCYYTRSISRRYDYLKFGTRTDNPLDVIKHRRPDPPERTSARPGTEAKIIVMQERISAGYSCFHHEDATLEGHTPAPGELNPFSGWHNRKMKKS